MPIAGFSLPSLAVVISLTALGGSVLSAFPRILATYGTEAPVVWPSEGISGHPLAGGEGSRLVLY